MKLAERINAARPEPRKRTLNEWLIALDQEDRTAAEEMAADPAWTNRAIIDFLNDENVGVGKDAIAVWRSRCGLTR